MLTKIKTWFLNEKLGPHKDGSFHDWKIIDLNTSVCTVAGCDAHYNNRSSHD